MKKMFKFIFWTTHTTYIDITEWFIEFVELCYKVADKITS